MNPVAGDMDYGPSRRSSTDLQLTTTQKAKRAPRCGLFCWRPDCLQIGYNWKLGLTIMCLYAFTRGIFTMGITSLNTSSFERRFNVDSQQIGWMSSANKIALSSTTIVFAYYGDRASHKPQLLALSAVFNAVGSFLMALPHLVMEPYTSQSRTIPAMCYLDENYFHSLYPNATFGGDWSSLDDCRNSGSSYFGLLIAGNIIKGIAVGIYAAVGVAFIDDFSTMAASSFHIGATYLAMSIGSAVGFGVGSGLLKIDANFDKSGFPNQNKDDPSFLGAWWLGYAISIGIYGLFAIGYLFFDYELPETAKLREEKLAKSQTHVSSIKMELAGLSGRNNCFNAISVFLHHAVRVLTNPVLLAVTIAHIINNLAIGGMQPFLVKILQTLWGLAEMSAGMVMGVLILIGIATGAFVSGYVAKKMEMKVRKKKK